MKLKLSLKNKMQLFLITTSVIIYAIAIGYISVNAKKSAFINSVQLVNTSAEKHAAQIESEMAEHSTVVRTLAEAFKVYKDMPRNVWDPLFNKMYDHVYRNNPDFYKLWDSWELNKIDPEWEKPTGRIANVFSRINGSIHKKQDVRSLDGDPEVYSYIKSQSQDLVLPIYFDVFSDFGEDAKLMTSLVSPILIDNEYHAMIGIDLILEKFQKQVENIKLEQFDESYSFLITQEGKYAGHPKTELLNEFAEFSLKNKKEFNILESIQKTKTFSITTVDSLNKSHYIAFAPIKIGKTNTPWYLGISAPLNSITAESDKSFAISMLVGFFGLIILGIIIYIITKNISDPIQNITNFLKKLARGETNNQFNLHVNSGDEIEEIADALRTSIEGLSLKTEFANNIGNGNLDSEFDLLSDDDQLGLALINMRNSLRQAKSEEENRKIEDEKRGWANEGLAKFADILRQNNSNINTLSNEIIKNLVYYLDANQGGLFLLNEEDNSAMFLDMISSFAYNREKHIQKKIEYGDGIVGSVAIEKETTYLEDLPDDYINITSGLGEANPKSLLVVPLKLEDNVYGVIEIASFNKIEGYQIEFVEKVAENIASTLSSVKVNSKTKELLEKSQLQSEALASQEEEMRQNMEELQATQEEASRKTIEIENFMRALDKSSCIVEYDPDGFVIEVNENYLTLLNLKKSDVLGTHHSDKMKFTDQQKKEYKIFWSDLKSGKTRKERTKYSVDGNQIEFNEVYTPIINEDGILVKILKISNSITDFES